MKSLTKKEHRTLQWIELSSKRGDLGRSEIRAVAARRLIELWECVKGRHRWTCINVISPIAKGSQRRWVRRNLYTLNKAGLVDIAKRKLERGAGTVFFKVKSRIEMKLYLSPANRD